MWMEQIFPFSPFLLLGCRLHTNDLSENFEGSAPVSGWLGAASWWAIIWTVRLRQRMKGDDYEHAGNTISLLLSTIFHLANKNIFDVGGQRAKTGFSSQMHLRFSIGFYLRRLLNKLKIAMQTVDRKPTVTWADNTMVRKIFNCNTEKYLKQWGCETIFFTIKPRSLLRTMQDSWQQTFVYSWNEYI